MTWQTSSERSKNSFLMQPTNAVSLQTASSCSTSSSRRKVATKRSGSSYASFNTLTVSLSRIHSSTQSSKSHSTHLPSCRPSDIGSSSTYSFSMTKTTMAVSTTGNSQHSLHQRQDCHPHGWTLRFLPRRYETNPATSPSKAGLRSGQ